MVVIAKARISAEFRAQFTQDFGYRADVLGLVRDIIASQHKHIRPQPIGDLYGTRDVFEAGERAVMDVG